jgi:transposase
MALGGEARARLLPTLGASASADTVLRLVRRAPVPPTPTPRVLGVDEWARRKGHTYGTVLVDLERRAPVDLLDDRSAESFARWLTEHPGVEVITRDRSEIYAEGARQGAPDAVQVADRWHLLKNVGDVVERVLHRHRPALEEAARQARTPSTEEVMVGAHDVTTGDESVEAPTVPVSTASPGQQARQTRYEQIQALHAAGRSIHAIGREVGMSRPTVRKYLRAPACPTRAPRRTKIGAFTAFDTHLQTRWEQGCRDAVQLWRELQTLGFGGTYRSVQRHVARGRAARDGGGRAAPAKSAGPRGKTPSPRRVRWWLVLPDAQVSAEQRRYVSVLTTATAALASARALAVEFGRVLREHDTAALEPWMTAVSASELAEFRDFVGGLRRDGAAVRAAVEQTWSNGQSEGQVTRIKLLKRQMYGRASVAAAAPAPRRVS